MITQHYGAGVAWTGPCAARPRDVLGLGISSVTLSDDPDAARRTFHETAVEMFYKIALTQWTALKPDIQYIRNPGGDGTPSAVVATLRFELRW